MHEKDLFNLQFSRSGLERLLAALDVAYLYVPTRTDEDAFIQCQIERIEKLLKA